MNQLLKTGKNHAKAVFVYMRYLLREFKSPHIYVMALIVGGVINLFMGNNMINSYVPYIVPVVVQAFSRGSLNYVNRLRDKLLELPMERNDPAFIITPDGAVVHAGGKTRELFEGKNIHHLKDFLCEKHTNEILEAAADISYKPVSLRVFSDKTKLWYDTKVKRFEAGGETDVLVWMDDITPLIMLDRNLSTLRNFSSDTLSHIHQEARQNTVMDRLASLILRSGYQGVFITRTTGEGSLAGQVYKWQDDTIIHSGEITIHPDSHAPVFESRKKSCVVLVSVKDFPSREIFEQNYPLDNQVKGFLGFPIRNFVNYHEAEFSITVFNKIRGLNNYDGVFIETAVNNTRSILYLLDLAGRR